MDAAPEKLTDASRVFRNRAVYEPVPDRAAAPVLVECLQDNAVVPPPFDKAEGPGPDGLHRESLPAHLIDVVLRHDPRADPTEAIEQNRIGFGRVDDDFVRIDD